MQIGQLGDRDVHKISSSKRLRVTTIYLARKISLDATSRGAIVVF